MPLSKAEKLVLDLMDREGLVRKTWKYDILDLERALGVPIVCDRITDLVKDRIINKGYNQLIGAYAFGGAYASIIGMKTGIPSAIIYKDDIVGNFLEQGNLLLFGLVNDTNLAQIIINHEPKGGYKFKDILVLSRISVPFYDSLIEGKNTESIFTEKEFRDYFNSKK